MQALPFKVIGCGGGWFDDEGFPQILTAIGWYPDEEIVVGFIPTTLKNNADSKEPANLRRLLDEHGIKHFSLTNDVNEQPTPERARELTRRCKVWVIFGGNLAEMLERWRESGVDRILIDKLSEPNNDITVVGSSAGIGWMAQYVYTADFVERTADGKRIPSVNDASHRWMPCYGLLPIRLCLHFNERKLGKARAQMVYDDAKGLPIGTIIIGVDTQAWFHLGGPIAEVYVDGDRTTGIQIIEVVPKSDQYPDGLKLTDYPSGFFYGGEGEIRTLAGDYSPLQV
jgi:peptidase E